MVLLTKRKVRSSFPLNVCKHSSHFTRQASDRSIADGATCYAYRESQSANNKNHVRRNHHLDPSERSI